MIYRGCAEQLPSALRTVDGRSYPFSNRDSLGSDCYACPCPRAHCRGNYARCVFIVRPLSLAATALGVVMFVVALPVSIPTGSVKQVGKELVVVPFKYTFVRPVGAFD